MNHLKSAVGKLSDLDKYCTIGFDKVALTHHLQYCHSEDYIDGFIDFGDTRIPDYATHSLIRGINRKNKQPVAYYFTQNLSSMELVGIIQLVVRTGLFSPFVHEITDKIL